MSLAKSLRPKRFSEFVGQEPVTQNILSQVQRGTRNAWMFHGENGSGKTTLARIMAVSFQLPLKRFGEPTDEEYTGKWDILEVNASAVNKVEDAAMLVEQAAYAPSIGKYKCIILDEAHRMTDAAQNLLLKELEDTPKSTIWFICTTAPYKILRGIKQRCLSYQMCPLLDEDRNKLVERAAKLAGVQKPLDKLKAALENNMVTSGRAVVNAVELFAGGAVSKKAAAAGAGDGEVDGAGVCRAMTAGDFGAVVRLTKGLGTEDARSLRLMALAWLGTLLKGTPGALAAAAIEELAVNPPYEDPAFMAWFHAKMYRVCKLMAKARQ